MEEMGGGEGGNEGDVLNTGDMSVINICLLICSEVINVIIFDEGYVVLLYYHHHSSCVDIMIFKVKIDVLFYYFFLRSIY